jgi:hypothetical protein
MLAERQGEPGHQLSEGTLHRPASPPQNATLANIQVQLAAKGRFAAQGRPQWSSRRQQHQVEGSVELQVQDAALVVDLQWRLVVVLNHNNTADHHSQHHACSREFNSAPVLGLMMKRQLVRNHSGTHVLHTSANRPTPPPRNINIPKSAVGIPPGNAVPAIPADFLAVKGEVRGKLSDDPRVSANCHSWNFCAPDDTARIQSGPAATAGAA